MPYALFFQASDTHGFRERTYWLCGTSVRFGHPQSLFEYQGAGFSAFLHSVRYLDLTPHAPIDSKLLAEIIQLCANLDELCVHHIGDVFHRIEYREILAKSKSTGLSMIVDGELVVPSSAAWDSHLKQLSSCKIVDPAIGSRQAYRIRQVVSGAQNLKQMSWTKDPKTIVCASPYEERLRRSHELLGPCKCSVRVDE